jgi:DNA invertase Pin-like site-specific DNA recombinase
MRLSVDDDNLKESDSIQNQRDLLRRFVAADPILSAGEILEYPEDGWSGTNFERPKVRELLDLARRGGIQTILVKDLSRWGRNYIEVNEYLEQIFPFLGIRFISVNDRYDSEDFKGQTAPMDVAFSSLVHDVYCKELSMKVRQSYVAKAKKGEFLCGEAPFGFVKSKTEKNRLEVDAESAEIVRRIFALSCGGNSTGAIAALLNADGADTPLTYRKRKGRAPRGTHFESGGKAFWNDKIVRKILTDERYIGVQVSGKTRKPKPGSRKTVCLPESEWIKVPGAHEAIVTEEIFKQANAGIVRYSITGGAPKKHQLFAGKLRCGHCGRAMKYQGSKTPFYYCDGHKLNAGTGCSEERLYEDDLKAAVLSAVQTEARKTLDADSKRRLVVKRDSADSEECLAELKRLSAQSTLLERRNISLYEDFAEGKITREEYLNAKNACAGEVAKAEARTAELNARLIECADENEEVPADVPLLRRIVDAEDVTGEVLSLVERIVVYDPERIEIRFTFGDTNAGV